MKTGKVLLFAGTTEGRELAVFLSEAGIGSLICVATEYGKEVILSAEYETGTGRKRLSFSPYAEVRAGRLDEKEIEELSKDFDLCIDATHPYADKATGNIRRACLSSGVRYLRLKREEESIREGEAFRIFGNVREAAEFLSSTEGNIFISTGSRDLEEYTVIPDYRERISVRVLPAEEPVRKCRDLGIEKVFTGKGPFSREENYRDFKASGALWLVTKESGKAGGFREKADAAAELGMKMIVIKRPEEGDSCSMEEIIKILGDWSISEVGSDGY